MGRRRKKGRPVSGILLLDKPKGISSNKALQQVKNIFKAQKAGHTGSLDPLATGVLPVCLGEATKVSGFLLDADKRYRVQIKLGEKTTTADAEGEVVSTAPFDSVSEAAIKEILPEFTGVLHQLPPMYSALKHNGERLYKLAREGVEVEREPREITIFSLDLISVDLPYFELDVHCSKGTYVRTLAEDIGEKLGCGAHVTELRRTAVGVFDAEPVSMEKLESVADSDFAEMDCLLLPIDSALADWQDVHLSTDMSYYLRQGQAVMVPKAPANGMVRLYDEKNGFLGVGVIQSDGKVAPKRLMLV